MGEDGSQSEDDDEALGVGLEHLIDPDQQSDTYQGASTSLRHMCDGALATGQGDECHGHRNPVLVGESRVMTDRTSEAADDAHHANEDEFPLADCRGQPADAGTQAQGG